MRRACPYFRVVGWRELEHGGHFAAWEWRDDYATGVRATLAARSAR